MERETPPGTVTLLLRAAAANEDGAGDRLWSVVYEELRRLARSCMQREGRAQTLQPTALVNEAFLRLLGAQRVEWANRKHFFSAAGRAMRHICVDSARMRNRLKRGGGRPPAGDAASDGLPVFDQDPAETLAIDEALTELEGFAPRASQIVQLRYFAGMTITECAAAMEVSPRTVDNEWRFARTWLHGRLGYGG